MTKVKQDKTITIRLSEELHSNLLMLAHLEKNVKLSEIVRSLLCAGVSKEIS